MLFFENTNYLWGLLLLVPLAWLISYVVGRKKKITAHIGNTALAQALISNYSEKRFRLKSLLFLLAILLGIFAFVNIQKPSNDDPSGAKSGIDVMVALDVSKSMLSADIKPTRLAKAKQVISQLIDQLGDNRLGIVVFAGQAITQMPLTDDIGAAKMYVSTIDPDMMPIQGTEIGDALKACNRAFHTGEKKYKAVVLISDGEDHDPKTENALKELKNSGVVVHTIGVGTIAGSQIIDPATNEPKKDAQGNTVISKLNAKELQNIAAQTGGQYALLDNGMNAPKKIATAIDNADKKMIRTGKMPGEKNFRSYFPLLIVGMVLLLVVELFISERKKSMA
ncbi:MAG: VWA domain-containing protein [Chitinophagaceae bacterium]